MTKFDQKETAVKEMIYTYMKYFGITHFQKLIKEVQEKIEKEKNFQAELEEYDGEG